MQLKHGERGVYPGRAAAVAPRQRRDSSESRADLQAAGEGGPAAAERPAGGVHRHGARPGDREQRAAAADQRARGGACTRDLRGQGALRDRACGRAHGAGPDGAGAREAAARAGPDRERARAATADVRRYIKTSISFLSHCIIVFYGHDIYFAFA